MIGDPITLAIQVAEIFDRLEIPYLVGGSVASSLLGEPTATLDVDMVADLTREKVPAFVCKRSIEEIAPIALALPKLCRRAGFP